MKTLYCKKVDLTLFPKFRKTVHVSGYHLYFLPTKNYTPLEVEAKIREKKDEILERLNKKFNSPVKMFVREYPVEEINVKSENYDIILTDAGAIS